MKSKEEIEQLAKEEYPTIIGTTQTGVPYDIFLKEKEAYQKGYTQCQEDIFNELNEWIVVTLSAESKLGASDNVIEALLNVMYKIESLNKQD